MLSAFKNFFITFLIAAIVFGSAAYFVTGFLTNTITSIFDKESSELEGILTPSDSDKPSEPSDTATDTPVGEDPEDVLLGESFNMLFIVTDYQPDLFGDYFPDEETLDELEEATDQNEIGYLGAHYRRPRAVATVLLRADKERKEFTYTVFSAATRISTSVGDYSLGEIYDLYGHDYIVDIVAARTGLPIDYYLMVNVTELYDIVNEMGNFSLYLTQDLYYNGLISTSVKPLPDQEDSLPLLYEIGTNTIDGSGAIALMMWEDASSAAAMAERNTLLVNVLTAIVDKLTTLSQAEFTAFYDSITEQELIRTNFTTKDLVSRIDLIYAHGSDAFTVKTVDYPGRYVAATETDDAYFSANTSTGIALFKNYRRVLPTND